MKVCAVLIFFFNVHATAQKVSEIGLGWAGNTVNTVVFRKNSVVTHGNHQYVSYYDSSGHVVLAKRKTGSKEWQVRHVSEKKMPFSLSGVGTKCIPISRPPVLINSKKNYVVFRDAERGDKGSVSVCHDPKKGVWHTRDLTTESVGHWELPYDTALWQNKKY